MFCGEWRRRGFTLVSVLVLLLVTGLVFLLAMGAFRGIRTPMTKGNQNTVAIALATELTELFRSMSNDLLLAYLRRNPGPTGLAPYTLCTPVNFLDRETGQIASPDPLANLTDPPPSTAGMNNLNRFYRVEVIDRVTLVTNAAACGQDPNAFGRGANESFVVTVGVSWMLNRGDPPASAKEVTLSTILTDG